ncbi:MAG: hypothetical protein MZU91_01930 [Desulfosudis oleivorans]|nr:hypothetical protein [Desulfosudis oleivorans]
MVIIAPALPSHGVCCGATYTTTGTLLERISEMISIIVSRLPPGVLSSMISTSAFRRSAASMPRSDVFQHRRHDGTLGSHHDGKRIVALGGDRLKNERE